MLLNADAAVSGVPVAELTRVGIQTYQGASVQGSRGGERGRGTD